MKLLCYTLFKTGTHSLRKLFKQTFCDSEYEIEYKHIHNLKKKDFDIIFITVRSHLDIYPSAFFQDITKPQYEYSYFREDINKNIKFDRKYYNNNQKILLNKHNENSEIFIDDLINFFLNLNWNKYQNLNYFYILKFLNQIIKNKIEKIENKKNGFTVLEKYNVTTNKKIKIVFIDLNILNDKEKLIEMLNILNLKFDKNKINGLNLFLGNNKWYNKIYEKFKEKLKLTNYYTKNKNIDDIFECSLV